VADARITGVIDSGKEEVCALDPMPCLEFPKAHPAKSREPVDPVLIALFRDAGQESSAS
jgi:hypothetical protein